MFWRWIGASVNDTNAETPLRLIVLAGATAGGETRLGVELAHALDSEIVSVDSRQVYRGLDIGSAGRSADAIGAGFAAGFAANVGAVEPHPPSRTAMARTRMGRRYCGPLARSTRTPTIVRLGALLGDERRAVVSVVPGPPGRMR